eukprot:6248701-Pyramimonas_sp.AAC.1
MVAGLRARRPPAHCVALCAESAWSQVCASEGRSALCAVSAGLDWQVACTLFGPLRGERMDAGLRAG